MKSVNLVMRCAIILMAAASSSHTLRNSLAAVATTPPSSSTTTTTSNHNKACNDQHEEKNSILLLQKDHDDSTRSTIKHILGIIQTHKDQTAMKQGIDAFDDDTAAVHDVPVNDRPYVCVSFAQTINGHIAVCSTTTSSSSSCSSNLKLSSPESFLLTHALRSKFDAILIGGNTLTVDNPRLNNRLWDDDDDDNDVDGNNVQDHDWEQEPTQNTMQTVLQDHVSRQPIPIILDTHLNHVMSFIRKEHVLSCAETHPFVILCCSQKAHDRYHKDISEFCTRTNVCIKLQPCECNPKTHFLDIKHVMHQLRHIHGIKSIMVEGGASILSSFLIHDDPRDLVDCICITICPKFILERFGLNALTTTTNVQKDKPHGEQQKLQCSTNIPVMKDLSSTFVSQWHSLGPDCIYLGISNVPIHTTTFHK